jgi:hypothetical protein
VIDRDALLEEIRRREGQFLSLCCDYGEEGAVEWAEVDHEGIASFVIEMVRRHTFTIEEQP